MSYEVEEVSGVAPPPKARVEVESAAATFARQRADQVGFHAQNSAGLIGFARDRRTIVRPGLMLYGSSPVPTFAQSW